mgnify:CR=1 FL=1
MLEFKALFVFVVLHLQALTPLLDTGDFVVMQTYTARSSSWIKEITGLVGQKRRLRLRKTLSEIITNETSGLPSYQVEMPKTGIQVWRSPWNVQPTQRWKWMITG